MADQTPTTFGNSRADIGAEMVKSLAQSRATTLNELNSTSKVIEDAGLGLSKTIQSTNDLTNQASNELLDALRIKRNLAETPKIVKGVMSLLGHDEYNENIQNLRIQESNAKLGVAAKRLEAGKEAYSIAIQSAQTGVNNAIQKHTLQRQSIFDTFAIKQNLDTAQKTEFEGMSDTALLRIKKNPGEAPEWLQGKEGLIDAELRRRQSNKLSVRSQEQQAMFSDFALKQKKKDVLLSKLQNKDVKAIADGNMALPAGLDMADIERDLESRQSRFLALDAAKTAKEKNDMGMYELHLDQALKSMSSTQLQLRLDLAIGDEPVELENGLQVSKSRLSSMLAAKKKAERTTLNENVRIAAVAAANEANMNVVNSQVASMRNMYENKQLPPDIQAKFKAIDTEIVMAHAAGSVEVVSEKVAEAKKLAEEEQKKLIASLPKTEQKAGEEYISTGRIRSAENQFSLLGTALSNTTALTDNPILDPLWREVSKDVIAAKARVSEGFSLGDLTKKDKDGEGAGGPGLINITQPKKAQDDVVIANVLRDKGDQIKNGLANTLYQKALSFTLYNLHEQAKAQGISNDPWGQFVQVINGEPEFKQIVYDKVPVDPKNPNGPTRNIFNPQKLWETLAALSVRGTSEGRLAPGSNYGTDLTDAIREHLNDFEKAMEGHLHGSMEASAFTNLITGGSRGIKAMVLDKLEPGEQSALQALQLGESLQANLNQQTLQVAKQTEMQETNKGPMIQAGPFLSHTILRPSTEATIRDNAARNISSGNSNLKNMIDILRSSSQVRMPEE